MEKGRKCIPTVEGIHRPLPNVCSPRSLDPTVENLVLQTNRVKVRRKALPASTILFWRVLPSSNIFILSKTTCKSLASWLRSRYPLSLNLVCVATIDICPAAAALTGFHCSHHVSASKSCSVPCSWGMLNSCQSLKTGEKRSSSSAVLASRSSLLSFCKVSRAVCVRHKSPVRVGC